MGPGRTDEFRKDAVRIALSSKDQKMIRGIIFPEDGLARKQIADDLGGGMSTLNKWITAHRDTDVVSHEDRELARQNERLRRENRILDKTSGTFKKRPRCSSRPKSREVQVRRRTPWDIPGRAPLPGDEP